MFSEYHSKQNFKSLNNFKMIKENYPLYIYTFFLFLITRHLKFFISKENDNENNS